MEPPDEMRTGLPKPRLLHAGKSFCCWRLPNINSLLQSMMAAPAPLSWLIACYQAPWIRPFLCILAFMPIHTIVTGAEQDGVAIGGVPREIRMLLLGTQFVAAVTAFGLSCCRHIPAIFLETILYSGSGVAVSASIIRLAWEGNPTQNPTYALAKLLLVSSGARRVPGIIGIVVLSAVYLTTVVFFETDQTCKGSWDLSKRHQIVLLVALFVTTLPCLCWRQGQLRDGHDLQRQLVEEVEAQGSLIQMLCDAEIWLADDGDTVTRSGDRMTMMAGRDMLGTSIKTCLSDEDAERFCSALQRAQWPMPASVQVTMRAHSGAVFDVDVLIIDRRQAEVQDKLRNLFGFQQEKKGFLIGVRRASEGRGADFYQPATTDVAHYHMRSSAGLSGDERDPGNVSAVTLCTAKVFSTADTDCGSVAKLQRLRSLAGKEHWLLEVDNLEVEHDPPVLGAGSYGVVLQGAYLGTRVAVKIPRHSDDKFVHWSAFFNEIRVLRQVRHPNIVLFHGACITPNQRTVALVFELISGVLLKEYIGTAFLHSRFQAVLDICAALRYLHGSQPRLIHGDLKPDNVMVEELKAGPRAKLLDFGLSRIKSKRSPPCGGTRRWMAPEIVTRKNKVRPDPSSDVYSFGLLLYSCVTGRPPYADHSHSEILELIRQGLDPCEWPEKDDFTLAVKATCKRALCREWRERASVKTLHASLLELQPSAAKRRDTISRSPMARPDNEDDDNGKADAIDILHPGEGPATMSGVLLQDTLVTEADAIVAWFDPMSLKILSTSVPFAGYVGDSAEGQVIAMFLQDPKAFYECVQTFMNAALNAPRGEEPPSTNLETVLLSSGGTFLPCTCSCTLLPRVQCEDKDEVYVLRASFLLANPPSRLPSLEDVKSKSTENEVSVPPVTGHTVRTRLPKGSVAL
eukprot:TRINITY_DN44786_c0_g1_i1.p1 TRINITY_DN44786_c0_g1~~TRINITY_DN44786_c0_g1_i1.p1  ORF type:complete len:911 (+),score=157.86 TRINITY_DN44786_c0_g1_i1:49-2781(+)